VNRRLFGLLLSFSFALALASACSDADVRKFRVEGAGMSPTLEDGRVVTVHTYSSGESPEFGDIIVFRAPTAPNREFIKRVIGIPGDTIEVGDGAVILNGEPLEEPYAAGPTSCTATQCRWVASDGTTGPAGLSCAGDCYFVLGDNRQNSSDSRQGWLVPHENIIGYVRPD
jgi:signal peptidase I